MALVSAPRENRWALRVPRAESCTPNTPRVQRTSDSSSRLLQLLILFQIGGKLRTKELATYLDTLQSGGKKIAPRVGVSVGLRGSVRGVDTLHRRVK